MTMKNPDSIPSRKALQQQTTTESEPQPAKAVAAPPPAPAPEQRSAKDLSGRYRVREGYTLAHGVLDASGHHKLAKGGETIHLSHDEAVSVIKLTMHQKNADGTPNGPAIETEDAYNARVEAKRQHDEFMRALAENNPLFDQNPNIPQLG